MSKSKRKKAENKKTKIKLGKKLPKNVNETKGKFKTAKIVLRHQYDMDLSTSDRISDILSRLKNQNCKLKNNAILNLSNFLTTFPNFDDSNLIPHVSQIIDSFFPAIFDEETSVRRNFRKTLTTLVKKANLEPFSDKIGNFLECSLSHVSRSVRFDTLGVVDLLLPVFKAGSRMNLKIFKLMINLAKIGGSLDNSQLKNVISTISRFLKHFIPTSQAEDKKYYFAGNCFFLISDDTLAAETAFPEFVEILTEIWHHKLPDERTDEIDVESDYGFFLTQLFSTADVMLDFGGKNRSHWTQQLYKGVIKHVDFPFKPKNKTASKKMVVLNLHICRVVGHANVADLSSKSYLMSLWSNHVFDSSLLKTSCLFNLPDLNSVIIPALFHERVILSPHHKSLFLSACEVFERHPLLVDLVPEILPLVCEDIDGCVRSRILELCIANVDLFGNKVTPVLIEMIGDGKMSCLVNKVDSNTVELVLFLFVAQNLSDLCGILKHFVHVYDLFTPPQLNFFLSAVFERIRPTIHLGEFYSLLLTLLLGVLSGTLESYSSASFKERVEKVRIWRNVVVEFINSLPQSQQLMECYVNKINGLYDHLPLIVNREIADLLLDGCVL